MTETDKPRAIRSFVTRAGRITEAQVRALEELWPKYGVEFAPEPLDLTALFGREAPRSVEIGFGNGDKGAQNFIVKQRYGPAKRYGHNSIFQFF